MKNAFYENKIRPFYVAVQNILFPSPHLHKEIEIIYVAEGKSRAHADRFCYEMEKGDVFICFPNQIHYYDNCIPGRYYVFIVSPDVLYGVKQKINGFEPASNILSKEVIEKIKDLMEKAVEVSLDDETIFSGIMHMMVGKILPEIKLKPLIKSDNTSLKNILNYCQQNFKGDITLDKISEEMHLSKYYISRLLNQKLDIGFNDYINTLRINYACDLLLETDKKIADISEDTGFGSIRSFNRSFSKIMNMTPLQYREMQKISPQEI